MRFAHLTPAQIIATWFRISDADWDRVWKIGLERDNAKRHVYGKYGKQEYHNSAHAIGCEAEFFYGELIGEPMKATFELRGDGGADFTQTDLKSSTYVNEPWLRVTDQEWKPDWYFTLVVINLQRRAVRYCGYATSEAVAAVPLRSIRGPLSYTLSEDMLIKDFPPIVRRSI